MCETVSPACLLTSSNRGTGADAGPTCEKQGIARSRTRSKRKRRGKQRNGTTNLSTGAQAIAGWQDWVRMDFHYPQVRWTSSKLSAMKAPLSNPLIKLLAIGVGLLFALQSFSQSPAGNASGSSSKEVPLQIIVVNSAADAKEILDRLNRGAD